MDPFSVYAPITVLDTNGYKVDPAQYLIEPPSNGGYPDYGRDFFNSLLTERWIPAHGRLVPAVLTSKDGIYALQPADPIPNPYIDPKEDPLKPIDAKQLQMSDYDIHFQDYETFARDYEPPVDLGLWGNVARAHDRRMGYILRPDGFLCPCPASGPLLRFEKPVRFDRIRLGHCISLYDADDDWYDANARDADAIDPRGTMIPRGARKAAQTKAVKKLTARAISAGNRAKAEVLAAALVKPPSGRGRAVSPKKPVSARLPTKRAASPRKPASGASPRKPTSSAKPPSMPSPKKAAPSGPFTFAIPQKPASLASPPKPVSAPSPSRASPVRLTRSTTHAGLMELTPAPEVIDLTGDDDEPAPAASAPILGASASFGNIFPPPVSAPVAGPSRRQFRRTPSITFDDDDAPTGYTYLNLPLGVCAAGLSPTRSDHHAMSEY